MIRKRELTPLLLWIGSLAVPNSLYANPLQIQAAESAMSEDSGGDSLSLKDILDVKVSVASLFEERDLDLAATVFATQSSQWRQQGSLRTFDAIRKAPSTMVYDVSPFSAGPTVAMRGFNDPGQIPSISILWDGINLSSIYQQSAILARPNVDLGVLDKIEMIVGPGSSLYGSDALQGVVSLVTPDVTKNNISADVAGGSLGTYRGEVKIAQELAPKLHVGVNLSATTQGDQLTKSSAQTMSYDATTTAILFGVTQTLNPIFDIGPNGDYSFPENYTSTAAVAKVRYDKTEAGFYWTGYDGKGFPGGGTTARVTALTPPFFSQTSASGNENDQNSKLWMAKLSQEVELPSSIDLTATGFYWKGSSTVHVGNNAGPIESYDNSVNQSYEDWRTGLSLIARRKADGSLPIKIAAGYSLDFTKISSATETLPNLGISHDMSVNGKSRSINAIFLETDTALIGRTLHLWLDGREDFYNDFGSAFSPRAGLIYQPDEVSAVKLLYGRAFRAPSSFELLGNPAGIAGNPNLLPDTQDSLQLQYMRREKTWDVSATAYGTYWNNQVVLVSTSTGPQYNNSTGISKAYGLELGGHASLLKHLQANANASYVRSFGSPAEGGGTAPYTLFPTYIVNWGFDYHCPSTRLTLSWMNRHQIKQGRYIPTAIQPNMTTIGAISPSTMSDYFRSDLGVTWDFGKNPGDWQLTGNIRNIFNATNYQAAISPNFLGQIPEPGINGFVGIRAKL